MKKPSSETKPTNPKDAVGIKKAPLSTVPCRVMAEIGVAMMEGARKYGRHNYRTAGVRASVYFDATMRHLMSWWEGQDIDPASGLSHIIKALASLTVLRDSMTQGMLNDDRPPPSRDGWEAELQGMVDKIFDMYPESKPAITKKDVGGIDAAS